MKTLMLTLCYMLFISTCPLNSKEDTQPVCKGAGEVCKKLNKWYQDGNAVGNSGDYYDNRDRNHSRIKLKNYPQLSEIEYSPNEKTQHLDWGGQRKILPHVTIGNSSTAGKFGSNARAWYYTTQEGMAFLHQQYQSNNLYIYPEHNDYDPIMEGGKNKGKNDVLPTNSPYLILSKGSSGSDRPFLDAFIQTLAAFDPTVKTTLVNAGILMPTLQQIFRMSNSVVVDNEDYLTGKAHPPVFEGSNIRLEKMVDTAHEMTIAKIPPLVAIREIEITDDSPSFKASEGESIANTPSVIAKIYKGTEQSKKLLVTAKGSQDLLARPLTYHWVVLSGDKDQIEIETKDGGSTAEILIPYQPPYVVNKETQLKSSRIDIGVFVDNGVTLSAPAFITVFTLPNELRTYNEDGNIQEIYYAAKDMGFQVKSWSGLIRVLSNRQGAFPSKLLQERFDPDAIAMMASEEPKIKILEKDLINAETELAYTLDLRKKLGNRLVPHKEVKRVKNTLADAQITLQQALKEKHPALNNRSIKESLIAVIEYYANDLSFYPKEKVMINNLSKDQSKKLQSIAIRLSKDGVFDKITKKLTLYEKAEIEEMNLFILSDIIYPNIISMWIKPNYVDPRITKPESIIRQFEYDTDGKEIGQTEKRVP
jgi:hypothetical protein